ncbi:MAG: AAA family ATPase [Chloroflexi bacterium]|nr:AAA family ATPase [Chloroflexota bacterium]
MDANQLHRVITEILKTACTNGQLDWNVLAEWERQWNICQEKLPLLEHKVRELGDALIKAMEPPLHYAVFLRPAPGEERDVVVGTGGGRLEVHLTDQVANALETLTPGQELVLNKDQNVVALRHMYAGGETAEVVNILKPEQAGEVLEITQGTPKNPLALRVRWREGEEEDVECSEELAQTALKRGDIVEIDPDRHQAISKVRPRLHVRAGGHEGIVVEISDQLFEEGVQIGDIVRVETNLKFAFEKLPSYETGGLALEEIPDVSYEDIGGLEGQIEQVYDAIELPYLYRAQFEEYQLNRPKGLLLYGPPGCGKTMIAKAVANSLTRTIRDHLVQLERRIVLYNRMLQNPDDAALVREYAALLPPNQPDEAITAESTVDQAVAHLRLYLEHHRVDLRTLDKELHTIRSVLAQEDGIRGFFLNVKGPELLDKYVGETEHRIRKIFEEARRYATFYTPVVIFFDEMESMFRARGSGRSSDVETTIVPQFLAELDGVEASENLIVIGASNRAELIDPAIMRPGRLDIKIKVDRPTRESALDIFALYLLPTLPLNSAGVDGVSDAIEGLGKIVFRKAYRASGGGVDHALTCSLPEGCDFRLARFLSPEALDQLGALPPRTLVREAVLNLDPDGDLVKVLRRFQSSAEIGAITEKLLALHAWLDDDRAQQAQMLDYVRREWLAEAMILDVIQILYSPASLMNVLTNNGSRYTFYIKDFVSGAVIANIVARAKKSAVKRVILGQANEPQGISLKDLHDAVYQEFNEGKDQLAQTKISAELGLNEQLKFVELVLQTGQIDPWNEDKLRPYETFA